MTELPKNIAFEEFIQSDLFTFYIGEEKKQFIVHSKAVAATSPYFDRLVNGGLSEAQSRTAEIEDVDPETFIRFMEYAYRRNYTTPLWTRDPTATAENGQKDSSACMTPSHGLELMMSDEEPVGPTFQAMPITTNWDSGGWNSNAAPSAFGTIPSTRNLKKHNNNQMGSRVAFNQRQYMHPTHNASSLLHMQFDTHPNTSPTQNFAPVFLAHARLYTLADMHMVKPLKDLALYKLHRTLVGFELYPERLGDVVEIARYAYEHGEDRSEDGKIDALRDMVVNYVACEVKVLGKHTEFRNLMDGGGEFAGDFWDIVSQELF
ncbi:hypothetical protein BU25DRAFT_417253 [Macroventuria anomochaeta]|uniref:Uncharacterized protein n=1 Tax=Macroventuria anomochaeta TaxID=301207 RepID=A0ACB6SEJ3_9PLEO|nr:uncharacterized protein BU25DRAFT_417253 [Macroventuria anomochaeta]KAF2632641.1 hypothetical protein BU25DRAFT_417253 [Macroventuria anomochaeta]